MRTYENDIDRLKDGESFATLILYSNGIESHIGVVIEKDPTPERIEAVSGSFGKAIKRKMES